MHTFKIENIHFDSWLLSLVGWIKGILNGMVGGAKKSKAAYVMIGGKSRGLSREDPERETHPSTSFS